MTEGDLNTYIDAVLEQGQSVNSQAKLAKVNVSLLRRLVIADPRYAAAKAEGKIETKDFSSPKLLQESPLVVDVVQNRLSYAEAASKYGLSEQTVRLRVRKAWPEYSKRGLHSVSNSSTNDFVPNLSTSSSVAPGPPTAGLLPLISWATARDWNPAEDSISVDQVEAWMPAVRQHSPKSYVLRVEDNGMTPLPGAPRSFPMGCLIFVDTARTEAKNGDRVVALIEDTNELVFRIYHAGQGGEWLEPLNPSYPVTRSAFKVVGAVFGKWEDA